MLCNSLLEVAENANQTFWLNGKRPKLPSKLKWSIRFWLKVWLLLGKVEMETRIFWHRTAIFDRIRPTGQRGPPVEVDHFHHRQSNEIKTEFGQPVLWPEDFHREGTRKEAFHLFLNRNFQSFWQNGENPTSRSEKTGDWKQLSSEMDTAVTLVGGSTVVTSFCIAHPCK